MIGRLATMIFDCDDIRAAAEFYAAVLGMEIVAQDDDWIDIGPPGAGWAGRVLSFQHAPGTARPTWPDPTVPQQAHLDIAVTDLDEAEAAVLSLGARRLPSHEDDFRVYSDPAGHPFCLVRG